jgi:hypothetical protein
MNPFKVGDTVYTVRYGKCVVKDNLASSCKIETDKMNQAWVACDEISFTPWPKANHERPIQDGWWIVTHVNQSYPMIRKKKGDITVDVDGDYCNQADQYTFHKFLGDSWK